MASAIIAGFRRDRQSCVIDYLPRDGDQIIESLKNRECDVGILCGSPAPDAGPETRTGFDARPLGRFVVAVIVNEKNPARSMTLAEAKNLFGARRAGGATW